MVCRILGHVLSGSMSENPLYPTIGSQILSMPCEPFVGNVGFPSRLLKSELKTVYFALQR